VSRPPAPAAPIVHQFKADDFLLSPPDATAQPSLTEIPELIGVMLKAIARHGGVPNLPKKTVSDWFLGHALSNGWVIDRHLADAMATCCRSVILMKGGNHWQKPNPKRVKPLNPLTVQPFNPSTL
jgi:hypothetical protein